MSRSGTAAKDGPSAKRQRLSAPVEDDGENSAELTDPLLRPVHYYSSGQWYAGTSKADKRLTEGDERRKRKNMVKAFILRNCGRFPSVGTISSQLRSRPGILAPGRTVSSALTDLCKEGLVRREGGRVVALVGGESPPMPTKLWRPAVKPEVVHQKDGWALVSGKEWAVDRILGHGVRDEDGAVFYRVAWLGRPPQDATWESEASLCHTALPLVLHYRLSISGGPSEETAA